MSTDVKAEPKAETKPPVDDAVVVNDEQKAETSRQELVDKVSKALGRDEWGDKKDDAKSGVTDEPNPQSTAAETKTEETPPEAKPEGEDTAKADKPALDAALQARAEKAGLSQDQAERLNQGGLLAETLTAFDKVLVERFQAEKPEKKEPVTEAEEETEEMPELDPDIYDEEIIKRDRYHKSRIDNLESQLEGLLQDRQDAFDGWLDGSLTELGYDIKDEQKCQKTFKAYKGLCEANDVSPEKRDKALLERAHAAMYPEDVKKQEQQATINRLRDAEGKFLSSTRTSGEPPQRDLTPDEANDQLVSKVTSYLKKKGVEMSGV